VQTMTMNTTRQLVADRQGALRSTARHARLRRLFSRANDAQAVELDITALEHAETATPALILPARPRPVAVADGVRADKVA
jgi:hypothetical protein